MKQYSVEFKLFQTATEIIAEDEDEAIAIASAEFREKLDAAYANGFEFEEVEVTVEKENVVEEEEA